MKPLIYIFTILFSFQLFAQNKHQILQTNKISFSFSNPKYGLNENSIQAIKQDTDGFMWFGTPNGLYKFDGYNYKIYQNDHTNPFSLSENNVIDLFEDAEGLLWICTDKGLNTFDKTTNRFRNYLNTYSEHYKSAENIRINTITQDGNGSLWLGTSKGLCKVEKKENHYLSFEWIDLKSNNLNQVFKVLISKESDKLFVASNVGIHLVELKQGTKHPKVEHLPILKNSNVYSLFEDQDLQIWIGGTKGLYKLDKNKNYKAENIFPETLHSEVTNIIQDPKGVFWIGTLREGLFQIDIQKKISQQFKKHKKASTSSIRSNDVLDLFIDTSGSLWVGSSRGGLAYLDLYKKDFIHFNNIPFNEESLSDNIINSFLEEDNQEVWIGSFNSGLNKLSFKNGKAVFRNYALNNDDEQRVFSICKDNFGFLWVATRSHGLYRLKLDKDNNIISKHNYTPENTGRNMLTKGIYNLYKDRKGDIWMGSFVGFGLMKFRPEKQGNTLPNVEYYSNISNAPITMSSSKIISIFEDSRGILWVGTRGGLNKIYRNENNIPIKTVQFLRDRNDKNSLSNNNVFTIQEDSNNDLWIGTFGGGISKIIEKEEAGQTITSFQTYKKKQGLSDNSVYGILEDAQKNLWISTNNGISKFNLNKEVFTNYDISDGLQNRNFRKYAYHKGPTGLLYFGGINGFNVFDPAKITNHTTLPKTAIIDFKIFNKTLFETDSTSTEGDLTKSIERTKNIELSYDDKEFSFEFAALHYASPENNKYAYKLEGYDKNWIYTDANRRYATYSNLEHGDYIFKVKSANKDNLWNEEAATLSIKILPPFWKTWWMYLFYLISSVGVLVLFRNIILTKENYNTQIKLEKFEREKIKEVNKIKLQFFTNISHEFKTPLTLILGPLEKLIESDKTDASLKDMLVLMQRNANQLYKLIQQVLEFRKVENNEVELSVSKIDLVAYCKEIVNSFRLLSDKKNIDLQFLSSETEVVDWFDTDKIEKITNNLLSNAFKFTQAKGKISFKIIVPEFKDEEQNYVTLEIEDSGSGIPEDKIPYIFNRFYQVKNSEKNAPGSGVGLALTKSLIQLHSGTIEVKSKKKHGTTFIVQLPLGKQYNNTEQVLSNYFDDSAIHPEQKTEEATIVSKEQLEDEVPTEKKKPLLLIVEDMADMRSFVKSLLSEDYEILEAENGLQGKEIALEAIPDIIISDVMMPKMDGIELCKALKTNELTSHIPVILLTAKSSIDSRTEGIQTGADAYIPKPFHGNFLKAKLENLLSIRKVLRNKYRNQDTVLPSEVDNLNEFDKKFLEKAEEVIEKNLMNTEFSVIDLGNELAYSRMQLYRKLKSITELSANEFIRSYRLKKAATLLRTSDMNITEILYEVGFGNRSYFTKCFKQEFDKTPKEYRTDMRNPS